MTTKQEMIQKIKAENPEGLKVGSDQDGYTQLTQAECETLFEKWAEARLAKEAAILEAEQKKSAAVEKLAALGLDLDDLKALGLG